MSRKSFWKCRCMGNGNKHNSGVEVMSGTWKIHNSLAQEIYPYGLHRELYQVIDVECGDLFGEDNVKLIRIRNSNRLLRIWE